MADQDSSGHSTMRGFLKPFSTLSNKNVSPANKVARSYVFSMERRVSPRNHVVKGRIDSPEA
jgi:hypothetical protein